MNELKNSIHDNANGLDYTLVNDHYLPNLTETAPTEQHPPGRSGRWQGLAETPLTVADGGHNPHGMTEIVRQLNAGGYERLYMVLGFSADKELDDILPLLPGAAYYLFTQAASPRALPAAELAAKAERYGLHGETLPEAAAALARARALASPHDMIFIGGSFYLIGEII